MAPPSTSSIRQFLREAKHFGPGVDGLPYTAWRYASEYAYHLLFEVSLWLYSGRSMGIEFNKALQYVASKGDEDLDHVGVLRSPCDTRPHRLEKHRQQDDRCLHQLVVEATDQSWCQQALKWLHLLTQLLD